MNAQNDKKDLFCLQILSDRIIPEGNTFKTRICSKCILRLKALKISNNKTK